MLYITQDATHVTQRTPRPSQAPSTVARPVALPSTRQDMRPTVRVALETARLEKELTIDELAEVTGIDAETLRRYESGRDFPKAADIATLQVHLETKIAPK